MNEDFKLSPLLPPLPHKWLDPSMPYEERISDGLWMLPESIMALSPEKRTGYRKFVALHPDIIVVPRPTAEELSKMQEDANEKKDTSYRYLLRFRVCRLCEQGCGQVNGYSHCCHDIVMTADLGVPYNMEQFIPPVEVYNPYHYVVHVKKLNVFRAIIARRTFRLYVGQFKTALDAARAADNFLYWAWKDGILPKKPKLNIPEVYSTEIHGKDIPRPTKRTLDRLEDCRVKLEQHEQDKHFGKYLDI